MSGPETISLQQLRAAIETMPDDWLVITNAVGNLAFYSPDGRFMGYLNFWRSTGEYHDHSADPD